MPINVSKLMLDDNNYITYKQHKSKNNINKPGIIFLHGFRSDMRGDKVMAIEQYCLQLDYDFIAFDCLNHGFSSGDPQDGTISIWLNNFLHILDNLANKPFIFVGSSMGGWLALLGAIKRPELCHSIVGLAPAPDFTEDICNNFSEQQKNEIDSKGYTKLEANWCTSEYMITKDLIEDGKNHLLLTNNKPININKPIRLIHGLQDKDVSYQTSMKFLKNVVTQDVQAIFIKDGEHRLSRPQDMTMIIQAIANLMHIE